MADQLEILKRLQAVDGELYRLRREERDKPKELARAQAEVAAQEAATKSSESKMTALQLSQKEKEGELQTREGQVKKLQGQLFQVKTNKEYSAMQHEIEALKTDNSLLEEIILKTLDALEQAGKERKAEQAKLAQAQDSLRREQQRIEQELEKIRANVAKLELDRKTLTPDVPKPALATYERILVIRDGLAMVPVVNDSCGGCYRRLPPQVINQVYLKADLVTCENCNRILYFDEAHSKL
jgi:predicted  nucleic acid-binding Zn-ribbon protein